MPGKGRSTCKGPGVRESVAHLRRQNKASVAGAERVDGMSLGRGKRGRWRPDRVPPVILKPVGSHGKMPSKGADCCF